MKCTKVSETASQPNPHHVDARKVYDSPHAVAVGVHPPPGGTLKKHATPAGGFFFVPGGAGHLQVRPGRGAPRGGPSGPGLPPLSE